MTLYTCQTILAGSYHMHLVYATYHFILGLKSSPSIYISA